REVDSVRLERRTAAVDLAVLLAVEANGRLLRRGERRRRHCEGSSDPHAQPQRDQLRARVTKQTTTSHPVSSPFASDWLKPSVWSNASVVVGGVVCLVGSREGAPVQRQQRRDRGRVLDGRRRRDRRGRRQL